MANGVWVCDLVPYGKGMAPRVLQLVQAMPDPKPVIAWSTTEGLANRPKAFGGIVGASAAQIDFIDGDNKSWAIELPAAWRTRTWSTVPNNVRNRLTTRLGIDPNIAPTDLLPVAMDKILAALDDGSITSLTVLSSN